MVVAWSKEVAASLALMHSGHVFKIEVIELANESDGR